MSAGPSAPSTVGPDEPAIALQWMVGGGDGLFLERPDGTGRIQLGKLPGSAQLHPDWSPDGRLLAFEGSGPKAMDIWIAAPDGNHARKLIERNDSCTGPVCGDAAYPAWSPDGQRIAFIMFDFAGESLAGSSLATVDVATGRETVIWQAPNALLDYPRWSRDGRRIAFETTSLDKSGSATGAWISVVEAAQGAGATALTTAERYATFPDWSPRADLIVFSTYDLGEFQQTDEPSNLYLVRPDGSGLRQITHYGRADQRATQPTWTPDGRRILFTLVGQSPGDHDNPRQAAFINPDGTNLVTLDGPATHPRLRPTP